MYGSQSPWQPWHFRHLLCARLGPRPHPLSLCVPAPGRKRQHHPVARQPCPAPSCLWPHWTQPPSREALGCRAGAGRARPVAGGTQEPWLHLCSLHTCGELTLQQRSGPKSLAHQVLSPEPRAMDSFPLHPSAFWPEPLGPHPGAATPVPPATSKCRAARALPPATPATRKCRAAQALLTTSWSSGTFRVWVWVWVRGGECHHTPALSRPRGASLGPVSTLFRFLGTVGVRRQTRDCSWTLSSLFLEW